MIEPLIASPDKQLIHGQIREKINELIAIENAKEQVQLLAGLAGGRLYVSELQVG